MSVKVSNFKRYRETRDIVQSEKYLFFDLSIFPIALIDIR